MKNHVIKSVPLSIHQKDFLYDGEEDMEKLKYSTYQVKPTGHCQK